MIPLRFAALLSLSCSPFIAAPAPAQPAETTGSGVVFLPPGNRVPGLLAHPQEARVGVRKEAGTSRLKLDIGTSVDLVVWSADSSAPAFAAGIDFFTYALTTSSEGLRLQVDAVDGFFGGHVSCSVSRTGPPVELRLRLLHLSAHFVDGHYDQNARGWKDGREPLPFTRDFGELVCGVWTSLGGVRCRVYSGFSYATLVRPVTIRRFSTLHGVELSSDDLLPPIGGSSTSVYLAGHLTVAGIPSAAGTASVEGGVKFGSTYGRGVRVYGNFVNGPDIFSQYFDMRRTLWGLGFAFDVW